MPPSMRMTSSGGVLDPSLPTGSTDEQDSEPKIVPSGGPGPDLRATQGAEARGGTTGADKSFEPDITEPDSGSDTPTQNAGRYDADNKGGNVVTHSTDTEPAVTSLPDDAQGAETPVKSAGRWLDQNADMVVAGVAAAAVIVGGAGAASRGGD